VFKLETRILQVSIADLGNFIAMVKKNAKQNGVAKKKAQPAAEDAANDVETVDLTAGADAADTEAPSTSKAASAKKKGRPGKVGTTMKAKASSSSARKGARPVKAPVRYEDPAAKTPKKKRAGKEGGGEYVVEAIRGVVKEKGEYKFLIKWENYSENSNTWEPPGNVRNCANQIKKFLDSVAKFGGKD